MTLRVTLRLSHAVRVRPACPCPRLSPAGTDERGRPGTTQDGCYRLAKWGSRVRIPSSAPGRRPFPSAAVSGRATVRATASRRVAETPTMLEARRGPSGWTQYARKYPDRAAFYRSGGWRAARESHLRMNPFCVVCGAKATVVDPSDLDPRGARTWIRATFRASAPSTTSRRPLLSPIEAASERRKGGSGDQSRHPGSALRFRMQEQSRRLQRRTSLRPFPQGARPSRARLTEVHTTDHPGPSTPRWIATAPRGLRNGCRRAPRSPGQGRHGRGLLVGGVRRVRHDLAGSTLPEALRDARCLGREVGAVGPQSDQRNSGRKA